MNFRILRSEVWVSGFLFLGKFLDLRVLTKLLESFAKNNFIVYFLCTNMALSLQCHF